MSRNLLDTARGRRPVATAAVLYPSVLGVVFVAALVVSSPAGLVRATAADGLVAVGMVLPHLAGRTRVPGPPPRPRGEDEAAESAGTTSHGEEEPEDGPPGGSGADRAAATQDEHADLVATPPPAGSDGGQPSWDRPVTEEAQCPGCGSFTIVYRCNRCAQVWRHTSHEPWPDIVVRSRLDPSR
jgi:hypothetical protein